VAKNLEDEACGILSKSSEINFQLNPESRGFAKIISSIYWLGELCDSTINLDMDLKDTEISEDFLRIDIKNNFYLKLLNIVTNLRFVTISLISLLNKIILYLVFMLKDLPFSKLYNLL